MLQEESMTDALRSLAAELDELGREGERAREVPEIPDFRLTDVLGSGGMGTVYLAEQVSLGREVALKAVDRSPAGSADEARTVAQLHHPNIVQVYAAGTAQGRSWFAMELMRGKTADHSEFASAEDAARLGVQIADALSYAHRCGVIHRDVKPSNIFIGEDGTAKLGDFGLANSVGDGGTRRYMAPELLDGGKATESSDQYALGVTLRELVPDAAADFAAICAKAAAPDPPRRYALPCLQARLGESAVARPQVPSFRPPQPACRVRHRRRLNFPCRICRRACRWLHPHEPCPRRHGMRSRICRAIAGKGRRRHQQAGFRQARNRNHLCAHGCRTSCGAFSR